MSTSAGKPAAPPVPPQATSRVKIHVDAECQATSREISRLSPRSWRFSTTNLILGLISVYLLACSVFTLSPFLQSQLVYLHYVRWPLGDLKNLQRFGIAEGRSVTISLNNSETLEGYHLLPAGPVAIEGARLQGSERNLFFDSELRNATNIVVYLHGNAATRAHPRRIDMIKHIATFCNAHVLSFDYRGFGDSIGVPSEESTIEDVAAIVAYITSLGVHNPTRVYLYGESLGTGVAVAFLAQHPAAAHPSGIVRGLVLLAPFVSLPAAALFHPLAAPFRLFPVIKNFMLQHLRYKYSSIDAIASIDVPILILHGTGDNMIPSSHGKDLFDAYMNKNFSQKSCSNNAVVKGDCVPSCNVSGSAAVCEPFLSKLVEIEGGDHHNLLYTRDWLLEVPRFINHN